MNMLHFRIHRQVLDTVSWTDVREMRIAETSMEAIVGRSYRVSTERIKTQKLNAVECRL